MVVKFSSSKPSSFAVLYAKDLKSDKFVKFARTVRKFDETNVRSRVTEVVTCFLH